MSLGLKKGLGFKRISALWVPANLGAALDLYVSALDVSDMTIADTDKVEQWNDLSGNDRHLTSGTTARPSYGATSGPNGKPGITFGGTTNMLVPAITATASEWNFFVGWKNTGTSGGPTYLFDSVTGRLILAQLRDNVSSGLGFFDGAWATTTNRAGGDQIVGFHMTSVSPAIRLNGEVIGSGYTYTPVGVSGTTRFGSHNSGGPSLATGTAVSIFLAVRGAMTESDRQKTEGWMAHELGMTGSLDASHPYKSTAPRV